jgi:hypothetical protein
MGKIMKNRWNVAITATVACVLSAPLAIAPYAARADELSDMRANQDLLQQRIDQLAQTVPGGGISAMGTKEVPGVGLVGGSFPRSFLIPGTDTSLRVGGQITEIVDYWFTGGPANNTPQTTTIGATGQLESVDLNKKGQVIGGVLQTAVTVKRPGGQSAPDVVPHPCDQIPDIVGARHDQTRRPAASHISRFHRRDGPEVRIRKRCGYSHRPARMPSLA